MKQFDPVRVFITQVILVGIFAAVLLIGIYLFTGTPQPQAQAAQPVTPIRQVAVEGWLTPIGAYQELTLTTTTAQELTVATGTHLVWLQAGDNNVRYRLDDVDPTTTTGFVLFAGDYILPPGLVYRMRFISESGTATLRAQTFGM